MRKTVIPTGWVAATLGEICSSQAGFGFPKQFQGRGKGSVPFAKVGDISSAVVAGAFEISSARNYVEEADLQRMLARTLPPASIVFAKIGEGLRLNRRAITTREMAVDNNVMGLVPHCSQIEPRWILHFMRQVDLGALSSATTVPSVRKSDLVQLPVLLPPLPEQRRIVAKIESLQARTRSARASLEAVGPLLDQFRRSVLAAAFRGDLTADWRAAHPDTEPASELLKRIRAERHRRWEEAELAKMQANGKPPKDDAWKRKYEPVPDWDEGVEQATWSMEALPSGWCWTTFAELIRDVTHSNRKLPESEYASSGTLPVIDQGEQPVGGYTDRSELAHPGPYPLVIFGDHTRCVKLQRSTFVQGADGVKVFAPSGLVNERFVAWLLRAIRIPERGYSRHFKFLRVARLPLPPRVEQDAIANVLDECEGRARQLGAMVHELADRTRELDQSILAKAFRGELVPQDPDDEPASVLLERIRAEREAAAANPRAKREPNKKAAKKSAPRRSARP